MRKIIRNKEKYAEKTMSYLISYMAMSGGQSIPRWKESDLKLPRWGFIDKYWVYNGERTTCVGSKFKEKVRKRQLKYVGFIIRKRGNLTYKAHCRQKKQGKTLSNRFNRTSQTKPEKVVKAQELFTKRGSCGELLGSRLIT